MKINITEAQAHDVVYSHLLELEEVFPDDKKLAKAVKRILSMTMIPTDWEMIYEEDFIEYCEGK
tara:strand:- start:111 stop:302 length:192 start_codon:yes stop_codon:yes gene_type:complete